MNGRFNVPLRVAAVSARDGAAMAGATYRLYDGGTITELKPGSDGNVQVDATPGTRRVVWASQGASQALMAIEGILRKEVDPEIVVVTV